MRNVVILGSTGSIGVSTLSVLAAHPEAYQVLALTAASQCKKLLQQCLQFSFAFSIINKNIVMSFKNHMFIFDYRDLLDNLMNIKNH